MTARFAFAVATFAILLPAAHAQASAAPPLLTAALTPSSDATAYAYVFTMTESGNRQMTITARIDPAKPEGQRVEILDAKGEDLDLEKIDERLERNANGDIWCDSMIAGADGRISEKPAANGQRIYSFTPRARAEAESDERKMFAQLTATAIVDESARTLQSFNAILSKPWKPNVMAKIHEFEMSGKCAAAPNGRSYAQTITTKIRGSALGQNFSSNNTRRITRLEPAG